MALTKADATLIARGTSNAAFTQLTGCSVTRSGTTATLTKTSHGRSNGDKVLIQGFSLAEFNGIFTVANAAANTFDYTISADPGANPSGTPGTVDLVTLGSRVDLTGSYGGSLAGGLQNGTTGPTIAPQLWIGVALSDSEAAYVWRRVLDGDSVANSWTALSMLIDQSVQYLNVAVARNTGQAVDCWVECSHITAV
ncbi:MAG: hypothetical protein RJA36_1259 [Pseudomonadota bacterium]|jgi:hypothetical protein